MRKTLTQCEKIILHMLKGKSIDRKYTINHGICWELSARICEIEYKYGVTVERKRVDLGKLSMTSYWLCEDGIEFVSDQIAVSGSDILLDCMVDKLESNNE